MVVSQQPVPWHDPLSMFASSKHKEAHPVPYVLSLKPKRMPTTLQPKVVNLLLVFDTLNVKPLRLNENI